MTVDPTYEALTECARRRISSEWRCSVAERELLSLIVDLSYAIGQSWCVVPCLGDFANACGIHKSTASRGLRSAVQKGYLQILSRQNETLYCVLTTTRERQDDGPAQAGARERLIEINRMRLSGQADPDGQVRLPGIFESEETEPPAAAFSAIVEMPDAKPPAEDRLDRLMRTLEQRRHEDAPPECVTHPAVRSAQRMEIGSHESHWQEITKGLGNQTLHCLEQIREECRQRRGGEAEFFQWRWKWRQRALKHPELYLEAAGVCKAMRLESGKVPDSPGAFIYRSVETALKLSS